MTKNDMRIELDALIGEFGQFAEAFGGRLRRLRAEMHNREPVMRGDDVSVPVTPAIVQRVWDLHIQHPDWPQHVIALHCGIQQARVSEILAGIRT